MTVPRDRRRTSRDESGSFVLRFGIAVIVVALLAGVFVALGWLPQTGDRSTTSPPVTPGSPTTRPGLHLIAPPTAAAVLPDGLGPRTVDLARLRAHLASALVQPALGGQLGFAVAPIGAPKAGWATGATRVMPASTLKLLTTTAALSELGPDHRFTTSVSTRGAPDSLILVGGGDPLLTTSDGPAPAAYPQPASLEDLAIQTAAKLAVQGIATVRLGYDASLFTGPAVNRSWPATYIPENVVSPVSALWVNEGRESAGSARRSADPALHAAEAFRTELRRTGITVVGAIAPQRAASTDAGPRRRPVTVAAVSSAPLQQIVQHVLETSDNEGAEVLLRQVAIGAGRSGSSAAGVVAVRAVLASLGLDLTGAVIVDGSGLSRDDEVPVQLLMDVLQVVASPVHPRLRGVVTGLPVAGFSGSLTYRFDQNRATSGRGYVRAKTGTLTGVNALAGFAMTKSGQTLVFVAVADRVAVPQTLAARDSLDEIAAALTTCGC